MNGMNDSRPANLENVFRGTFHVKKRDLPAKSGTAGRAHIEIFFTSIHPTEINFVPKYTVARRFGRGRVGLPFGIFARNRTEFP